MHSKRVRALHDDGPELVKAAGLTQGACITHSGNMAISDMDVRKAFKKNNLKLSDGAVASRITALAEEFGYTAAELSDKYDFYATNRCDAGSAPLCGNSVDSLWIHVRASRVHCSRNTNVMPQGLGDEQ